MVMEAHMTSQERLRLYRERHREEINARRRLARQQRTMEEAEKERDYKRRQYQENRGQYQNKHKEWASKLKRETMAAYGGVCAICGESHYECLTIDHSNGDGASFRRGHGYVRDDTNKPQSSFTGLKFYSWLKKNGFPQDLGLRVLCWNCNCSIGSYGYSPLGGAR